MILFNWFFTLHISSDFIDNRLHFVFCSLNSRSYLLMFKWRFFLFLNSIFLWKKEDFFKFNQSQNTLAKLRYLFKKIQAFPHLPNRIMMQKTDPLTVTLKKGNTWKIHNLIRLLRTHSDIMQFFCKLIFNCIFYG